jgi:hypothetical protein
MTIPERLKELLETEIANGAAGRLEDLVGVYIGKLDVLPQDKYPLVCIVTDPGKYSYNGNFVQIEHNYTLQVGVLNASLQEAEELRDQLIFDEQASPPTGLIPFLLDNNNFTCGSTSYELTVGETATGIAKDPGSRMTAAAEIPVTITTEITI